VKITDVQIDGFGVWSDLKLDQFSDGMTVFYGPNEAGKTTLLEFIRSVLYGFAPQRRARYLPPAHGGRAGGALGLVGAGGKFAVRRTPVGGAGADDLGKVEIFAANNTRQGQHVLGTLLAGIDEPIFNNVFAVGLREVQELGTLDDTEAADQLYKLTSGLDRVSLVDVMRQLEAARNQLLPPDGQGGQLLELLQQREKLQAEIQELSSRGLRWAQLAAQRRELQEEVGRLDENIQRMERECRAVEVGLQVRQDWRQRAEVEAKLKKLGPPIQLPDRAIERLDQLNAQIAQHREQVEQFKRQRRAIVDEAAAQPINRPLWTHAGRVAAVCEHGPWLESLDSQTKRLHSDIVELQKELRAQWEKMGLSGDQIPEVPPDVSSRAATTLRGPAEAVREAQERVAEAQRVQEQSQREAEEIAEQLRSELAGTGETELAAALDTAGRRVAMLRRRIQIEERLDKIDRLRKELEETHRDLLEEHILPLPVLVKCGIFFVLGIMMLLSGLTGWFWGYFPKAGGVLAVLGCAFWIFAVVTKFVLEQSMNRELDQCLRDLDRVKKQLRELRDEREELDRQLPSGGGPLDARVAAAEEYVKRLETLTPLDARRQTAVQHGAASQEQAAHAAEVLKDARHRWEAALRSVNLPISLQPEHIQSLSDGHDHPFHTARRLQARREELRQRESELLAITERVEKLLGEVNVTAASDDPRMQIRQLASALAEQQKWIQRRKELMQRHRGLKKEFRDVARQLRQVMQQRRVLINQAKVADEDQLRKEAARQAKIEQLTAQHHDLAQRITLAIGNKCSEKAVAEVLTAHGAEKLEQYSDRLLGRLQEAQTRLTQLHQNRGEMMQEMKTLAEDRRLAVARLQLGCVEQQIHRAAHRWRVLAVMGLLLEAIRQIYETERQPEVLAEASTHLERLTQGRYRRIWTPLAENTLRVDHADGESLPLDVLSQGTREAVFIGLRLALAAAYARRGALLPLVLDDVLVNFDTRRAQAAAAVLRDFANSGHQLLLFTCHNHILRIFEDVGVEVRLLPARDGSFDPSLYELAPPPASPEPAAVAETPEPAPAAAETLPEPEPAPQPAPQPVPAEPTVAAQAPLPPAPPATEEAPAKPDQAEAEPYDHAIWDDGEPLELADEETEDDLVPAGSSARPHWWDDSDQAAA
jgi:uncharacterized protein YhaN